MTRTIIAICGYTALLSTLFATAILFVWLNSRAAERRAMAEATRQDAARAVRGLIATLEVLLRERKAVSQDVFLVDYSGQYEADVKRKVLEGARREGFFGMVDERLKYLGWRIVQCELHIVNPNPGRLRTGHLVDGTQNGLVGGLNPDLKNDTTGE